MKLVSGRGGAVEKNRSRYRTQMSIEVSLLSPIRSIHFEVGSVRRAASLPVLPSRGRRKSRFLYLSSKAPCGDSRISRGGDRKLMASVAAGWSDNLLVRDFCTAALTSAVALGLLKFWEELAKLRVFEEKLSRKLVHISIGLVFMLFWPLFSSGSQAPYLAALAPGINIIRMILLGLGIWKNDALVKSMSRSGDYRELLKGPLYYALTLTIATAVFWRTSPVSLAAVCNLCAGDGANTFFGALTICSASGVADIVGRRFGHQKLPYNRNKSISGSIAMASAGFLASVVYMHYFSLFGFIEESWGLVLSLLVVSVASAIVESLPISTELDDNLTVPLTSVLLGSLVL